MQVKVKRLEKFAPLYNVPEGTEIIICIGGRGGAKTYEVSKAIAYYATIGQKRVQILRDEKEHIKESILNEVLLRYDTANKDGVFNGLFSRLDNGIKNAKTNEMAVFTKGFRASSSDKRANLKSVSNIDIAVIEEAEDIRDEDKFNTFADSIRKKGSFIIIILNTPDINHWIIKRYFNLLPAGHDGYYELQPKQIKGVEVIQTNFTDNKYLPDNVVERYNNYGNPESHLYNLHYYLTAIKGYASTGLRGQILTKYKLITHEQFKEIDALEVIGLDFGTSSPAGIVAIKVVDNKVYVHELNYEGLSLKPLAIKMHLLGFTNKTLIIADSAEPDTITDLRRGIKHLMTADEIEHYPVAANGFQNIRAAIKGPGSIISGINKLLSMELHVTENSKNYLTELASYIWATDRNGNSLDMPIDANNHLIDPTRYVISVKGRYF